MCEVDTLFMEFACGPACWFWHGRGCALTSVAWATQRRYVVFTKHPDVEDPEDLEVPPVVAPEVAQVQQSNMHALLKAARARKARPTDEFQQAQQ